MNQFNTFNIKMYRYINMLSQEYIAFKKRMKPKCFETIHSTKSIVTT